MTETRKVAGRHHQFYDRSLAGVRQFGLRSDVHKQAFKASKNETFVLTTTVHAAEFRLHSEDEPAHRLEVSILHLLCVYSFTQLSAGYPGTLVLYI